MKRILFVEIENFKLFGNKIRIDLGHPAVLIGPNNAGKTSVIQALALWSRGVNAWYAKKGRPHQKEKRERISAGINRLNILEIPVSEARFFWHNTRVRKGNTPIKLVISVGLEHNGKEEICRMIFKQRDSEIIYCMPCPETIKNADIFKYATGIQFNLLYPMSGMETEETLIQEGRINVLMGQGQTAQVLRNLCYKITENDLSTNMSDWDKITKLLKRIFNIDLKRPELDIKRGTLGLKYYQEEVENLLDISLAGRGLQQMLLILSYLYSHKGSVLLIDEPDAHLEILRQKQVYEILKEVAQENGCQVVIATHSEVILEDAIDTNLSLLIDGKAVDLATPQDMKNALRNFGIEHYYKAKVCPRILYVESSTDIEILKALAKKCSHPAYDILSGKLNYYYTQNPYHEDSFESRLDRAGGAFGNFKQHFNTIKRYVSEFKGIAIFDSDGNQRTDDISNDLAVIYWENYELENYFIMPEVLLSFVKDYFAPDMELFTEKVYDGFRKIIDQHLLKNVFNGDKKQLDEFNKASKALRRTLLQRHKMSKFAEDVFEEFAKKEGTHIILNKGEYYQLIKYVDSQDISSEISDKLDKIVEVLNE